MLWSPHPWSRDTAFPRRARGSQPHHHPLPSVAFTSRGGELRQPGQRQNQLCQEPTPRGRRLPLWPFLLFGTLFSSGKALLVIIYTEREAWCFVVGSSGGWRRWLSSTAPGTHTAAFALLCISGHAQLLGFFYLTSDVNGRGWEERGGKLFRPLGTC